MEDTRKEAFMAELQALLNKHRAELMVTDDGASYGQHLAICTITFEFEPDKPYCEFEIPTFMLPEKDDE